MEQLKEDLLSLRNSIDIAILIIDSQKSHLIFTQLEDIYVKCQDLIDTQCIES
jgi:hypothetical protein